MNDQQINNPNQQARRDTEISENKDTSGVYLRESTLQSDSEFEQDKKSGPAREADTITAAGVDDLQSNSDGAAGTDRAGTTVQKTHGDIELNKGLEAQAKDEES